MSDRWRSILLAAFVAALGVVWWLGERRSGEDGPRTFRKQLVAVDTAALQAFTIVPPRLLRAPLRFERDSLGWRVSQEGRTTPAFSRPLNELLAALHRMQPLSMPGPDPATLERYGLTDSLATKIEVPDRDPVTLRVGITTSGEDPATALMREGDPNVYLIPGDITWITDLDFKGWIPKPMVNGDPANWLRITFFFPGNIAYAMERNGAEWLVDGRPADRVRVEKYLHALSVYYGHDLVDPADTLHARPVYSLQVEDSTREAPITLMIYDVGHRLIARSNLAPPWLVMPFDAQEELPRMFRPPGAFEPH